VARKSVEGLQPSKGDVKEVFLKTVEM